MTPAGAEAEAEAARASGGVRPPRGGRVPAPSLAALFTAVGAAALALGRVLPRAAAGPAGAALVAAAAAATIIDALHSPRAADVRFARAPGGVLRWGQPSAVDLVFVWRPAGRARPRTFWWADGAPDSLVDAAPQGRGELHPDQPFRCGYRVLPSQRGALRWTGPRLSIASPAGLWRTRVLADVATEATVFPGGIPRAPLGGAAYEHGAPARGDAGIEFDGVRPYLPGDDARAIHWRATARRELPVARRLRPERGRRLLLVVDAGRWSAQVLGSGAPALTRLDAFCAAAVQVAEAAVAGGDQVGLIVLRGAAGPVSIDPRGGAALQRIAAVLADVAASDGDADASESAARVLAVPADIVLWFVEAPTPSDAAPLAAPLAVVARARRLFVLEVHGGLPTEERSGRFLAAAARQSQQWRNEACRLLARRAVRVSDVPLARLGAESVRRYVTAAQGAPL